MSQNDMELSLRAVEGILKYRFRNLKLLEDALTHSSFPASASYERLEFIGDSALGLAFSTFLYLTYPTLDEGSLTLLRSVNVRNEKLARVSVSHHFYRFIRHNIADFEHTVNEFKLAVMEEDDIALFGGKVKAPGVLADIVESIAAAVYVDCGFDLKVFWEVYRSILEPIITWEILQEQPQPVTKLFQSCQKQRKQVDIKEWRENLVNFADVYVNDKLVGSGSSAQKAVARLNAVNDALAQMNMLHVEVTFVTVEVNDNNEIIAAKQKLCEICHSKKWPKPTYRVEIEEGPSHDKRFICSVKVEVEEAVLLVHGGGRSRVKQAENSAASLMIHYLLESGSVQGRQMEGGNCRRLSESRKKAGFSSDSNDKDVDDEIQMS